MTTLRPGTPEEAGMSPARIENLQRLGAKWVEDGTHPALVLVVARRGVIVLHEAWGKQGPEPDAPALRKDAIFPIASISKVLTATCAMLLVEDGLLGLNRPVQEYIPEFQGDGKENVLVHHLLSHSAGFEDDDSMQAIRDAGYPLIKAIADGAAPPLEQTEPTQHPVIDRMLQPAYAVPLSYRPGERSSYSVIGYLLLGEVVRRVSGKSLVDLSQQRLFAPLGMTDTSFLMPENHRERLVRRPLHLPLAELLSNLLGRIPLSYGSASGTALDAAVFGQTFLNGGKYGTVRVLSSATVREMTRNQIPGLGTEYIGEFHKEASWGYGWTVKGYEKWRQTESLLSPETFWHQGGGGTFLWIDPVNELVCVFFSVIARVRKPGDRDQYGDLFANAAVGAIED